MKPCGIPVAALVLAASCSPASAQTAHDALPVYDATQVAYGRYTIVKRLWVETFKSALWIPGYRDESGARRALVDEASRLGAEAVVNLICFDRAGGVFQRAGFICYGDAVRLKAKTS